jgi:hypothetical protein
MADCILRFVRRDEVEVALVASPLKARDLTLVDAMRRTDEMTGREQQRL